MAVGKKVIISKIPLDSSRLKWYNFNELDEMNINIHFIKILLLHFAAEFGKILTSHKGVLGWQTRTSRYLVFTGTCSG